MKSLVQCSICITMFLTCGLFTPRTDFEDPVTTQPGTVDYFDFAALLEGTNEQFKKLDWYELFDDNFLYTNIFLAANKYSKGNFIGHLNLQKGICDSSLNVVWNTSEGDRLPIGPDTISLSTVKYTVACAGDTFSGISSFIFNRDSSNIWHIASWTDEPISDAFFSPDL